MKRTGLYVVAMLVFALTSGAFAQDSRGTRQARREGDPSPEAARGRLENLSPEQRAELRERWQNMSEEERAKFREQMRQRAVGEGQGTQVQDRKELVAVQVARLKEQHQATVGELEVIKQLALRENAKQTAEALTRLMAKHQQQFDQQVQAIERRMKAASGDSEAKSATPRQGNADRQKTREDAKARRTEREKQAQ